MTEETIVDNSPTPRTRQSLAADLRRLGLQRGATVLVHSSLSALGWVCGGPVAVIQALIDAVTPRGTLVMPAHSGDYSDPAQWGNPPVPEQWWQTIRERMPAFDPRYTPARGVGVIPETFRKWPGAVRSRHPTMSFAAWGRQAEAVTADHELAYGLGEGSPLARLSNLGGQVLLLGVGYESNTCFHLAEYRAAAAEPITAGAPLNVDGNRRWVEYEDLDLDSGRFPQIGEAMEEAGLVTRGEVGSAGARLFALRGAVDFAQSRLEE